MTKQIANFHFAILILQIFIQPAVFGQANPAPETFPFRQPPVDYFSNHLDDPVSKLSSRIEKADLNFEFESGSGYLRSLLKALDVPVESQMLVFAKNSVNARIISPENPRALYFNDNVYVGFVPGAPWLEISSVDSAKGAIFYTFTQKIDEPPRLTREESCLLCHASNNSLNVPGHLVRSFVTDVEGNPSRGYSQVSHDTPLARRWGGWYVTGDTGNLAHLGNLSTAADLREYERHRDGPGRQVDLNRRIELGKYAGAHSDVVALLVHDHQTHMHNLIARVNYEHQYQKPASSEHHLLRYLLFIDEAPLAHPVRGGSGFDALFAKQGPRDRHDRSLREFDLKTRLFKFRCSYLIYSTAFESLPGPVKDRLYRRIWEILSAPSPPEPYDKLPQAERTTILEVLRETKTGLPEYWKPLAEKTSEKK